MSKPTACLVCGAPLTQPATGRPRWYCKRACHQVAELERRRIVTRLATLDTYASNLRLMAGNKRQLGRVEEEVTRLTRRLVALLDGHPKGLASKGRRARNRAELEGPDAGVDGGAASRGADIPPGTLVMPNLPSYSAGGASRIPIADTLAREARNDALAAGRFVLEPAAPPPDIF